MVNTNTANQRTPQNALTVPAHVPADMPLIVSYGGGVDSTAMLVGMHQAGLRPDAILFANVGNEMPHTYDFLPLMDKWLRAVGFPEITRVQYMPQRFKYHRYATLAGNCLANRTLPSLAFGRKSCSLKWKGAPLDKWVKAHYGETAVLRAIGYDCSPADNKRFAHAQNGGKQGRPNDLYIYPLQWWGWQREQCAQAITQAGLPVPGKSSCWFCPAMKKHEVANLPAALLRLIVVLEANAQPNLRTVQGLWRRSRITDFILAQELLPALEVQALWETWSQADRIITNNATQAEGVLDQIAGAQQALEAGQAPAVRVEVLMVAMAAIKRSQAVMAAQ